MSESNDGGAGTEEFLRGQDFAPFSNWLVDRSRLGWDLKRGQPVVLLCWLLQGHGYGCSLLCGAQCARATHQKYYQNRIIFRKYMTFSICIIF